MSKMSQAHAELEEQAAELGFESISEAERNGYHIAYDKNGVKLRLDMAKAQEKAHEDWLRKKASLVNRLDEWKMSLYKENRIGEGDLVREAIRFIMEGEV